MRAWDSWLAVPIPDLSLRGVPNGVDLQLFHPAEPATRAPTQRIRCLAVARLIERKGLGDLIRAFALLERGRFRAGDRRRRFRRAGAAGAGGRARCAPRTCGSWVRCREPKCPTAIAKRICSRCPRRPKRSAMCLPRHSPPDSRSSAARSAESPIWWSTAATVCWFRRATSKAWLRRSAIWRTIRSCGSRWRCGTAPRRKPRWNGPRSPAATSLSTKAIQHRRPARSLVAEPTASVS